MIMQKVAERLAAGASDPYNTRAEILGELGIELNAGKRPRFAPGVLKPKGRGDENGEVHDSGEDKASGATNRNGHHHHLVVGWWWL